MSVLEDNQRFMHQAVEFEGREYFLTEINQQEAKTLRFGQMLYAEKDGLNFSFKAGDVLMVSKHWAVDEWYHRISTINVKKERFVDITILPSPFIDCIAGLKLMTEVPAKQMESEQLKAIVFQLRTQGFTDIHNTSLRDSYAFRALELMAGERGVLDGVSEGHPNGKRQDS